MRILLDECMPRDFAGQFPGHYVLTVRQAGWDGISNGHLLKRVADSGQFDVFMTVDKNLPHQNKILALPFAIVVLRGKSNRLEHLLPLAPEFLRRIAEFQPGHAYSVSASQ